MDEPLRLRILADVSNLATIRHFAEYAATRGDGDPEAIADMLMAMNEAVTNIVVHGYQGQPGTIEVEVRYNKDALVVLLRDQAPAFDPTQAPEPDTTLSLEQRPFGGMGIHMMRQLTDGLTYRTVPNGGNELILVRKHVRKS
jgi:serine/threonine-protein kinase RsbW